MKSYKLIYACLSNCAYCLLFHGSFFFRFVFFSFHLLVFLLDKKKTYIKYEIKLYSIPGSEPRIEKKKKKMGSFLNNTEARNAPECAHSLYAHFGD